MILEARVAIDRGRECTHGRLLFRLPPVHTPPVPLPIVRDINDFLSN